MPRTSAVHRIRPVPAAIAARRDTLNDSHLRTPATKRRPLASAPASPQRSRRAGDPVERPDGPARIGVQREQRTATPVPIAPDASAARSAPAPCQEEPAAPRCGHRGHVVRKIPRHNVEPSSTRNARTVVISSFGCHLATTYTRPPAAASGYEEFHPPC